MTVTVWEPFLDAFGNAIPGAETQISNYWAFATDPILGIGTPWGLQRVVAVAFIAILAQAVTHRRYLGTMMGFLVAFTVAATADAFAEVINAGVYIHQAGAISPLNRAWTPQALAYNVFMDFGGALFGTLFFVIVSANPFIQLGVVYNDVRKASVNGLLLNGFDVVMSWILAPAAIAVVEWFSFWGLFERCGDISVFRLDVLAAWGVNLGLIVAIGFLYVPLVKYPKLIVKKLWDKEVPIPVARAGSLSVRVARSKTGTIPELVGTADEIEDAAYTAVLIRHAVTMMMFAIALTVLFLFNMGKVLPGDAGFFFQPLVGMVIALIVVAVVRVLLHVFPTGRYFLDKVRAKLDDSHPGKQPIFSTPIPTLGYRSADRRGVF
jgi:hypothetical protein